MLRRLFGGSTQDPAENDSQIQESQVPESQAHEEADPPEPDTTNEMTSNLPDPSAEDASSIVNDLAFRDVSRSSPTPSTTRKRKRGEPDIVDRTPKKRMAKKGESIANGDAHSIASTNGITAHEDGRKSASLQPVQANPKKLSRPNKGQSKMSMVEINQAASKSIDVFEVPQDQAENPNPPEPAATEEPSGSKTSPRRKGRPRRVQPPPTQENRKSPRKDAQDMKVKPGRKGRPKGHAGSEAELQEAPQPQSGSLSLKTLSNVGTMSSRSKSKDGHEERLRGSKSKRSTAAVANRHESIKNTNTDATKKPVNETRRATKQRKGVAVVDDDNGEEDEGEKEETEIEGNRGSEEIVDKDRQASTYEDEGEEAGAEVEEEDSDVGDSLLVDESEGKELELFGTDTEWKTVLEGARSICGSHLPRNQMPKLFTSVIRDLILDVREARISYERLLPLDASEHEFDGGLDDLLENSVDAIENHIRELSENSEAEKAAEVIRDIFARAIPAMVFLLQSALTFRLYHAEEPCDLETLKEIVKGLREIVRLQKMAILLCEKATHWKAKPIYTSRPIVRPTTWKILPSLRIMNKAFSRALMEQDRKRKYKQNLVDSRKRQEVLAEASRQANQEAARKSELLLRKIRESREQEERQRRSEKRTFDQVKEDEARARIGSRQVNGHVESRNSWSDEEDIALYFELEKGYVATMTSAERYLKILNTRVLQNKLPNQEVQARRRPWHWGQRGKNTLKSTQIPDSTFKPQDSRQKISNRTFRVHNSTKVKGEEALRCGEEHLSPRLPSRLDAKTRNLLDFQCTDTYQDCLSTLGDSSSLFSESSPAPRVNPVKEHQNVWAGRIGPSAQQHFAFNSSPPPNMVVEREPPKASPQKPLQPATQANKQPEFGKPSPLGNRMQPLSVFNMPKPFQSRPEHHRPTPSTGSSHLQQVKDFAHKVVDPFRSGSASHPVSIQSSPDIVEVSRPAPPPVWNNYTQPTPTYSSYVPPSGFTAVNNYQRPIPIVDLEKPQVPSYTDPALLNNTFGAADPFLYVDPGKAAENIKALLEGAFDDEDDKPRTRGRKKKVDAALAGLTDKLQIQDVKVNEDKENDEKAEEEEDEEEEEDGTVEGLKVKLLPHQVDGVAWMREKETGVKKKNGVLPKGGILADDMGLGKTIQSIALLLTNPRPTQSSNTSVTDKKAMSANVGKSTLVVAPLALIKQWEAEIKNRVLDSHKLRVCVHHGPQRTKRFDDLKKYDVVVTTYQILVSEHNSSSKSEDGPQAGCFGIHWYRVILDEAHTIKNRNAKASQACYALRAEYRWCLTGTPMQNNLDELQSLIRFLRIKPYNDLSMWKDQITRPMSQGRGGVAMKRLQFYLKAFMKRRTKDVLKEEGALNPGGKPSKDGTSNGFKITARRVESVLAEFSPDERRFYDRLEQRTDRSLEQMMGGEKMNYASALVLLLRLRQACNHPRLVGASMAKDKDALTTGQGVGSQTPRKNKVAEDDVDEMADLLGGLSMKTKQCDVCQIELSKDEASTGSIRCTECEEDLAAQKGRRRGKKHKTNRSSRESQRAHAKARVPKNRRVILDDSEEEENGDWIVPEHERHKPDLGKAGGSDDENAEGGGESLASYDTDTDNDSGISIPKSKQPKIISLDTTDEDKDESSEDSSDEENDSEEDLSSDSDASLASITISAKVKHLLTILHRESATHKFIVFSQFTSMLDLIEPFLRQDDLEFTRYDGSMRNDLREASLERLRNNSRCRILLCSLKCGSLGLNLTAASRVVILEPFWNPFVEEQAIDRVHRLNQTLDVTVYKLTIANTVEARILDLQEKKRALAQAAIGGDGKAVGKLSMKDILNLFKRDAEHDGRHEVDANLGEKTRVLAPLGGNSTKTVDERGGQSMRVTPPVMERKGKGQKEDSIFGRRW